MSIDLPALLRNSSDRYHKAIAILNSQGIFKGDPEWSDRLGQQIKALALEQQNKAA